VKLVAQGVWGICSFGMFIACWTLPSTNADGICEPPSGSNRIIAGGYISLMAPSSLGSERCSLGSRMMAVTVPRVPFAMSPSVDRLTTIMAF